jgi:hypothetical protein
MWGMIGSLAGGLINNISGGGSQGCGMEGGLGNLIGKFLDPLGLLGGQEQNGLSQEDADKIIELLEELVAQNSEANESGESEWACGCEECSPESETFADNWQNIFISTGSGDDTVTIG